MAAMKRHALRLLKWSEKYTKTDMAYLASGTFWGNANYAIFSLMGFALSVLFARFLTQEEFGTYQYVLSVAGLIGSTALTGMNGAVTRAVARGYEGELRKSVRFQILLGVVPAAFAVGVGAWYLFHSDHRLALSFLWVALFLPLGSAFNTWAAYTGGRKLFRIGTYYGLANNAIAYAGVIAFTYLTRDFVWIAFANFFFGFAGNFLIYKLVTRHLPPNGKTDGETVRYGTHLSLMAIPGTISSQLDALLVFHMLGPAALAVYSFATLIPEKISGGLKFISNLALPKFSEKGEESVRHFLTKRLWMVVVLVCAVSAAYAAGAPWLFRTFFPAYAVSVPFTQVYALSLFSVIGGIAQTALLSQRRTKELYIANFTIPLLRSALLVTLMHYYGVWGVLWAQIITNFISAPFQMLLFGTRKDNPKIQ
jgi:O-antigen/teichoic acid export membrane protein